MTRPTSPIHHPLAVTPRTPAALHAWLRCVMDVDVPITPLDDAAASPFDYLCFTFLEHLRPPSTSPDCVVWASRGGGKTFYAAVATLLDLIFKPTIEIKVLGGSLDQSRRMHEHLRRFLERPAFRPLVDGRPTDRRTRLTNQSSVEILAQSHTSIRGTRPQKLRCDEVELFDPDVWRAAQLVTRSKHCGIPPGQSAPVHVRGTIEALSTMHKPRGLMSNLISTAAPIPRIAHLLLSSRRASSSPATRPAASPASARALFRWTTIDVLEHCPPHRRCDACELHEDCQGRAKLPRASPGHLTIDDAIILKQRADRASWRAEMLCNTPRHTTAVFPEYDEHIHLLIETTAPAEPADPANTTKNNEPPTILGMDFGYRGHTAILWARLTADNTLIITHERILASTRLDDHIHAIKHGNPAAPRPAEATLPEPAWIAADPAGNQRSIQSGISPVHHMRQHGLIVKTPRLPLHEGIEFIRRRLAPALGSPRLLIHPRCANLRAALTGYRYPDTQAHDTAPLKDGNDHAIDALRYLITALDHHHTITVQTY